MSTASLSASNQDSLLAHVSVGHRPSQALRSCDDDDESLVLCSLAKNRPACRRRGYDSVSSKVPVRVSATSSAPDPTDEDDEDDDDDDDDDDGDGNDHPDDDIDVEGKASSSPVIVNETHRVPYEEVSESVRKDVDHMINYDILVNSMVAQKRSMYGSTPKHQQSVTTAGTSQKTGSRRSGDVSGLLDSPLQYAAAAISRVSEKDMEKLREYVRMDRGLPLTKEVKKKVIEFRKEPVIRPKTNRATAVRTQFIRKCSISSSAKASLDAGTSIRSRQEEMMSRLKKLVLRYSSSSEQPLYKYNRGFEMRYQSNKGNPLMPSSFRDSYETYNKPLFSVPKKLEVPKRLLWPEYKKHEISYLGFRVDADLVPPQYQQKKIVKQRRTRRLARPPVRKTQRVRRTKAKPQPKSKAPWNYGVFERASKKLAYH